MYTSDHELQIYQVKIKKNEIDDMRRLGKTREILRSSGFDEVEDLRFVSSGGMLRLTPDLDAVYGLLSRFKTSMGETVEDIDRERLSVDNSIEDKKNEFPELGMIGTQNPVINSVWNRMPNNIRSTVGVKEANQHAKNLQNDKKIIENPNHNLKSFL